jgi:hypothetical protein
MTRLVAGVFRLQIDAAEHLGMAGQPPCNVRISIVNERSTTRGKHIAKTIARVKSVTSGFLVPVTDLIAARDAFVMWCR